MKTTVKKLYNFFIFFKLRKGVPMENIQIDLEKGSIFYHYKNLKLYEYLGPCKIQENNEWIEAVIYKEYKSLVDSGLFVRTKKEFLEKFKRR